LGGNFKSGQKGKVVSEDYKISRNGQIIALRGHMHDGGVSLSAFVNNKQVCRSEASYGLAGGKLIIEGKEWTTISKMSECVEPIAVKVGDSVRIEAEYDHVTHPLRMSHGQEQENMGFMTVNFVPDQ
jgi:hypothetical protein